MNTDIRIDIRLPHHWKYRKLKRLIGCAPMEHLVLFWTTVAEQIPNGQLEGWDADDIEAAAEWGGEPGVFFSAMLKCEFIDKADGCYSPHDWAEHQPWAVGAEERSTNSRKAAQTRWDGVSKGDKSAAAQKAAQARWDKKSVKPADSNAECVPDACGMHADSNAECVPSRGDAPSPLPLPKPKPLTTEEEECAREATKLMPVSEAQQLYVNYIGRIPDNQPIIASLQDICRHYPPERITRAFQAVVEADKPCLNWIKKYLDNPNNWSESHGRNQHPRSAKALGRKTGLIEANGAGTDFMS